MGQHWSEQQERSNPLTLKLICWLALKTSRRFARLLLYPITFYFIFTAPGARRASLNYLNRVLGRKAGWLDAAKHIHCFAATILDRVYFLTDQLDKFQVEIEGYEVVERYLQQQQGCILLGAHMGSFDALRSLAINRDNVRLKIMMYHEHNAMMMRVLDSLNPKVASAIINLADDNALLQLKESVEEGELVGMLADRDDDDKSCDCQLLGGKVQMSTGPLAIAAVVRTPVILFFPLYLGANRYHIFFEELCGPLQLERGKRQETIEALVQEYANRIEYYIRKAPLNWFNFYDYWGDEKKV
jgi:predicted LPLAT superfamily acyltransferase